MNDLIKSDTSVIPDTIVSLSIRVRKSNKLTKRSKQAVKKFMMIYWGEKI